MLRKQIVGLVACTLLFATTSCAVSQDRNGALPPSPLMNQDESTPPMNSGSPEILNLMEELTDKQSTNYLPEAAHPLIDKEGKGSAQFEIKIPSGVKSVRYFVTCEAGNKFSFTTSKSFGGDCQDELLLSGEIPLSKKEIKSGNSTINLQLPKGVSYRIAGIPM